MSRYRERYAGGGGVKSGIKGAIRQVFDSLTNLKTSEESKLGDLVPYEPKAPLSNSQVKKLTSSPISADELENPSRRGFLKRSTANVVSKAVGNLIPPGLQHLATKLSSGQ